MIASRIVERYDGRDVTLFILENEFLRVEVSDFGAIVRSIFFKRKGGEILVTMGAHSVADYIDFDCYCGGTIGRVSNRIGGAAYMFNGVKRFTDNNDNGNTLHGGFIGFDKRFYRSSIDGDRLILSLLSPEGDGGFIGNLDFAVIYSLDGSALKIDFEGVSDVDTFFAPTNHTYFTLGGLSNSDIRLKINADSFTPVDAGLIPTGELRAAVGTAFDFTDYKNIDADINADDGQLDIVGGGYDHNFATRGEHKASAVCDRTGISLDVYSDMPGVQFYSGNFLNGQKTQGRVFNKHSAFCLEPQFFPDSVNNDGFEKPIIRAGKKKSHYIRFNFSGAS